LHRPGCELRRSPGLAGLWPTFHWPLRRPSRDAARLRSTLTRVDERFAVVAYADSFRLTVARRRRLILAWLAPNREGQVPPRRLPVFPCTKFAVIVRGESARCE